MSQATVVGYEPIARGLYLEGLALDLQRGIVWYSDVIAGGIHGIYPDGRTNTLNPDRMWTGGVMVNEDGCVLSTGAGGIMWNNPETGASGWLLAEIDGKPINGINEMVPDGTGGIFFGTNDIEMVLAGQPSRPTQLYRLTADRQVIRLAEGLNFTNGIMFDAQRRRFYCNDSFVATYAFDVQPDLTLANKRVLADKVDADGMALDAEGNVWITGFRSPEIIRLAPDGGALAPVPNPGGAAVTQVRFGGADLRDVYINTVPVDAGDRLAVGELPTEKTSILYRGRADKPGLPVAAARFELG
jgi:sugar lactone lactonase YvrE